MMMKPWPWRLALALLLVGAALRVVLLGGYPATAYPDTSTYYAAARDLASGDYAQGQGRRTPGYPLLIAVVGEAPERIATAQMAIGLLTSLLLFQIAWSMTRRPWLAFAVGLIFQLNLQQLFVEKVLLTELLSTASVMVVVCVLLPTLSRLQRGGRACGMALLVGALTGASILVRPQFIFLLLLLPALTLIAVSAWRRPTARGLGYATLVTLPAIMLVLAWATVLYNKTGYFTLSTQPGFGMANHSVEFVEHAPERYAVLRDILLKYRAQQIAATGHAGNTAWAAWPEIHRVTGWTLPEASRELQRMSLQLFIENPLPYGMSVARAWRDFWTVPILWAPDRIQPRWLGQALPAVWWLEHKALRVANLAFVLLAVAALMSRRTRLAVQWDLHATAITALVLSSALLQALVEQGSASRYSMTTQSLVVLLLVVCVARWRDTARRT